MYRELHVRVHVRKPGRDSWLYVGRATVSHEVVKQTSRVGELGLPGEAVPMSFPITVVRTTADKVLVTFGEASHGCLTCVHGCLFTPSIAMCKRNDEAGSSW